MVAVASVGCQPSDSSQRQTATGVVISADGPDASHVDHFTLRSNDGQVVEFKVGTLDLAGGGLPAPHLREHLVSGIPITVTYARQGGENVASHYIDAPSPSTQ